MGTKVHCESLFSGYHHSMRDLNKDSNGCRWPLFCGDNKPSTASDQCYNGFPSQTTFGYEEDAVRRTMLEHEAVFKTQVLELHRVYRIQKDMMDELKRKQLNKEWVPIDASFSSQATNDDVRKWKIPSFPLANSVYDRPSMSVVEDNGHSPMKGSNSQGVVVGPVSWQNGASSKNVEMSEVRPTKIRRKMIDLCLPADEYIDDNEEVVEIKNHKVCGTSSQLPNGDVKTESRGDALRIGYGLNGSNGLADLNEPISAQETNDFAYGQSQDLRNGEFQGHIRDYGKSLNSGRVREHVPVISLPSDENGKPKVWPHQPSRIDHYTGTYNSAAPFLQPAKPLDSPSQPMQVLMNTQPMQVLMNTQPMQVLMNSSQRIMSVPNSGPSNKAGFWKERTFIDLEADTDTNSSHEVVIRQNHLESSLASQQQRHLYPYNPPDSAVSWNHLHSSWQNTSFGFPQKVASAQRYPVLNLSDTLSGNAQKQGVFGDRLQFESNSRFNSGCGNSSRVNHNMFYNECSSSSKSKFSGTGYNYPNGGRSDYSSGNPFMDSNGSEMKFVRDLNLNVTLSNTSVIEVRKDEEHLATLPWLNKPKSGCNSEMADGKWNLKSNDAVLSSLKPLDIKAEARNNVQNLVWLESLKSSSCSNKPETEKINANTEIPAFTCRDQSNAEKGKVHNVRMLDMNEPCDPLSDEDQQTEKQTRTKVSGSNRCPFDLNMSVSDDEGGNWSVPTSSRLNSKAPMIDLEAPAVPESDDEEENDDISREKPSEEEIPVEGKTVEKSPEFEKIAAETIVAIASACLDKEVEVVASAEAPETIILHWFAETVNTHRENLDKKLDTLSKNQTRSIEEIDYFESKTLQLCEISEEECMPKPLVPEDLKLEETSGTAVVTSQRPRRGNTRKGKQRRDFQRDILPGLLSLSKHEVTEDIHMFDGFMRATGSSWTPIGLARKKTGSRGRPRRVITIPEPVYCPVRAPAPAPSPAVQQQVSNQCNNGEVEMGLEDRSFAGWGKMTRRPRRQRYPSTVTASNQRSSSHAPFT